MTVAIQENLFRIAFNNLSFFSAFTQNRQPPERLGEASLYFPLVGFIFGLSFMLIFATVSRVADVEWACLSVLAFMIGVFTGRQYQSCFKFVGILGEQDEEREKGNVVVLDIIRVLFVFGLFMLKFLALTHLGKGWILGMLVVVPTVSCWSKVYLWYSFVIDVPEMRGSSSIRFVGGLEFWGATIFTTLVVGVFMGLEGLFMLMFISLWTAILERWVVSKPVEAFQSFVGVAMELNETLLLLGLIAMRKGFAISAGEGLWL